MIRHQGCQERTNSASKSIQMVDHRQIFVVVLNGFPLPMVNWSHIQFLRFDWMDPPLKRFLRGEASRPWSVTVFPPSHASLKRLYAQEISIQNRHAKMIQHAFKVSLDFSGFQFLPSYPIYSVFQSLMSIMRSQSANLTSSCLGIRRKQFSAIWVTLCMSLSCRIEQVWLTP